MIKAKIHKGLWFDCLQCNPEGKKKEKRRTRKDKSPATVEIFLKKQVAADLGEEEMVNKDERYLLLQKYGLVTPKIDRLVTKPNWMGVSTWKRKMNEWFQMTKGLVAPQQQKKFYRPTSPSPTRTPQLHPIRKWSEKFKSGHSPRQDTRISRPNYGQDQTENPQK
jgi:hypothetical protein